MHAARTIQVLFFLAACCLLVIVAPPVWGTPLHGLGNVFRAQSPEKYRESVMGVSDKAREASQLKSGTIEDLKKKLKSSTSKLPNSSSGSTASKSTGTPNKTTNPGGKLANQPGQQAETPQVIKRDMSKLKTASLQSNANQASQTQARMQAQELIEVLAYFNAENVNWDNHMGANCDYAGFRTAALEVLPTFDDIGAEMVAQAVGQELTGITMPREVGDGRNCGPHGLNARTNCAANFADEPHLSWRHSHIAALL